MSDLARRRESEVLERVSQFDADDLREAISQLIERSRAIHERDCINLNPATNVMNPRAEAVLSAGLSSRPSLGHPGEKYEMGLEAIEELEIITADLAQRVFGARFAEIRAFSGAMANQMAFMASAQPGDSIIVPPPTIGGHVTHNTDGVAGLYGLKIHEAPIDADNYTVDVDALAAMAEKVRPKLISIGASLNLGPHPVAELRAIADAVGAALLFDAAHLCGVIAGGAWPNPLDDGAHMMTCSTYKSLGGPAGGLLLTNDAAIAERVDAIAYPGLTANFDAGRTTALAITLIDWLEQGEAYAAEMVATASALAHELRDRGVNLAGTVHGPTISHQLAIRSDDVHGNGVHGDVARLRQANLLTCAIGLPDGDGVRIGTPEIVRWGMTVAEMPTLAGFIADALAPATDLDALAAAVTAFRAPFDTVQFCTQ